MTQLRLQEKAMDRREILTLYKWTIGDCFRCAQTDVPTILLGQIDPPAGVHYEARVCKGCALELEDERRRHAERTGHEYKPGQLGSCKRES